MKLTVLCLCLALLTGAVPAAAQQPQGVCARVQINLSQEVTLARTAFRATLEISNAPENVALQNVGVTLDIRNEADQPSRFRFGIGAPVLTNISDVNGSGSLAPGATARAVWTLLPTRDAAPTTPARYFVGGAISYTEGGTPVTIPLLPAAITVRPDPLLVLHYFWPRVVYGDDPFTPETEAPEPFSLGLLVLNQGYGTAANFHITSSQPQIVDNEKGLLARFKLLDARVNKQAIAPSLEVNLGDLAPQSATMARWRLTASVNGEFSKFDAAFEHLDDLGNTRTSLLDSVAVHELEHTVRVDVPADDEAPDFLANDTPDDERLPDTLYESNGTIAPVTPIQSAGVDGSVSEDHLQVRLTLGSAPAGFIYVRVEDPGQGQFRLLRVVRSDGREIRRDDNAWTTHRTIRLQGQAAFRQHRLHLFDRDSTGSYTLIYGQLTPAQGPLNRLKTLPDGTEVTFGSDPNTGGGNGGSGSGNGGSGNGDGSVSGDGAVPSGQVVVTAAFPDGMYVEAIDRSGGIKVVPASQPEGVLVTGTGVLRTGDNGERYIEATEVRAVGAGSVAPLGIATKPLYSGDFFYNAGTGAGQQGMAGGAGLNTVGLLVQTLGRVVGVGSNAFLVDDGYGRSVKVLLPAGAAPPPANSFVLVTGAASTEKIGGELYPVLRPRRTADLLYNRDAMRQTFVTPSGMLGTGASLLALPGIPAEPAPTAVLSPFDPGDGSGLQGRLSRYDAPTQSEIFFDAAAPGLFGGMLLGEGYRLRLDAGQATAFGFEGFRSDFADRWISLPRLGATRIGHPFPYSVLFTDVQVTDGMKTVPLRQAAKVESPNWLSSVWEFFDSAGQTPRFLGLPEDTPDTTLLMPWRGYWVISQREDLALIVPAQNAGPVITRLDPASATAGGSGFPLKVIGSGFVAVSTVQWNGQARETSFVSTTELRAEIPASDIAQTGTASVTVANPEAQGGISASVTFLITVAPPRDTTPPTSSVLLLLALTSDPVFTVSWSGRDEEGGSGLASFDIYVSDNNGAYTRWQSQMTATSASFTGVAGHTYRFYSIARDNAGNVEQAPATPDATTVVTSPVPQITGLSPTTAVVGGPAFILTVDGNGFVEGSILHWNGLPRQTTVLSPTQLRAAIPASDLSIAGKAQISVVTPAPGGGSSNGVLFSVGKVALRVTATLSRQGSEIVASVTLANTGTAPAQGLQVTVARLGSAGSISTVPAEVGEVGVGQSRSVLLRFAAPPSGTNTTLVINGIYIGGTFNSASRVSVP